MRSHRHRRPGVHALSTEAESPSLAVRVAASACAAALTTAITVWVEEGGTGDLPGLMEQAFDTLETPGAPDG